MSSRKQKIGIPMGDPVFSQKVKGLFRERDQTVLAVFCCVSDMDQIAGTVNVLDFEINSFTQSESETVDGEETDTIAKFLEGGHDPVHLFNSQNIRQLSDFGRSDDSGPVPFFF
jgi:hypothetical protein